MRAWAGFDEVEEQKVFVFSLGIDVNDEFKWNYEAGVQALFSNIKPMCRIDSEEIKTNEQNIIQLIKRSLIEFPEEVVEFIAHFDGE